MYYLPNFTANINEQLKRKLIMGFGFVMACLVLTVAHSDVTLARRLSSTDVVVERQKRFVPKTESVFEWEPYVNMDKYHSQEELEALLYRYEQVFPDIMSVKLLGHSVQGRKILAARITDSPHEDTEPGEPAVKYVANMHGNEVVGRELMLALVGYLCEGYYSNLTIRELVDSNDLWVVPTMNPDGFAMSKEGGCCDIRGRTNAHRVDLNRDFAITDRRGNLALEIEQDAKYQPETKVLADLIRSRQFVVSANFHGGAMVANYPYDYPYGVKNKQQHLYMASPDDAVFRSLSRVYADHNPVMSVNDPKVDTYCGHNEQFDHGVTNGAKWYNVLGGMQDYNYFKSNAFEITVEVGVCKYPLLKQLPPYWANNKEALLHYMKQASLMGVRGSVLDARNLSAIGGAKVKVDGIEHDVVTVKDGSFWRLLVPGTYKVSISADGYVTSDAKTVTVSSDNQNEMRFYLYPDSEPVPNMSEMVNEVKQEAKYRATMDPDAFIKQLASKYPALTHIYSIGRSTGGHEMNVLVISDQPKKHELGEPELKLISSLHGNEVVGLEMLATFAEYLLVNYGFNRDITWMIDNTRIHILLSANPDGRLKMLQRLKYDLTAAESDDVWAEGRENGNKKDLNRDFHYNGTPASLQKLQVETQNLIHWMHSHPFLLSLAYHGGSKVVCYPYDHAKNTKVEDIAVFRYISANYVETNPGMKGGYPCPKEWPKEKFPGGYLSGGDWYPFEGGMQDANYNFSNTLEVSIEVSCEKAPPAVELPQHWQDNRESLISFVRMAHIGVSGIVRNLTSDGTPLSECVISVSEIGHDMNCTSQGEFWRLLAPGRFYTVTASAKGFLPQTRQIFVSETRRSGPPHSAQRLTFVLKPVNQTNRQFQLEQNLANATTIGDLKLNLTSYEEMLYLFKALSKVFPDFATLKFLGSDVEGFQLIDLEVSGSKNSSDVPHMALFGGLFKDDIRSVIDLSTFAAELILSHQAGNQQIKELVDGSVIHFVPYFYPSNLESAATKGHQNCGKTSTEHFEMQDDLVAQRIHNTSSFREVAVLENWLKQQPLVFTLNVVPGFDGVFVPPEMDRSTESMVRGRTKRRHKRDASSQSNCPSSPSKAGIPTGMIESIHNEWGISSAMVGLGCCAPNEEAKATHLTNQYRNFSEYTRCLLSNVSSHSVVLIAQTSAGSYVIEDLEISCACNFSNRRPTSSAGRHQLLVTQPGPQNISASWRNQTLSKPVFVNKNATSPDVVNMVFPQPLVMPNIRHRIAASLALIALVTCCAIVAIVSTIWCCIRFLRSPTYGNKNNRQRSICCSSCKWGINNRNTFPSNRSRMKMQIGVNIKEKWSENLEIFNLHETTSDEDYDDSDYFTKSKGKNSNSSAKLGIDFDPRSSDRLLKEDSRKNREDNI